MELRTGDETLDTAFRIAVDDIRSNVLPFHDGLLDEPRPVLMAGQAYDTPWTRDAAINVWNGASLLLPETGRDTLLSVLERRGDRVLIGGQYWDAISWAVGAWSHYLCTGDTGFLRIALDAVAATLSERETSEYDARTGLFRGPACYGDGVSAYPDRYADAGSSEILAWPAAHPDQVSKPGAGIPMQTLSTNCLYYQAYRLAGRMAAELGQPPDPAWPERADRLRAAIDRNFWTGSGYRYLVDPWGADARAEGLGNSLVLLFGLADPDRATSVLAGQPVTPAGVPCVWPAYNRYHRGPDDFGRHSGTVWPHVQALWGDACARHGRPDLFLDELRKLARHACRDGQFTEIYHPRTGLPYGGLQERADHGITSWDSCRRQTWSATGYLRLVLSGLFGLDATPAGLRIRPGPIEARLSGLRYRDAGWDLHITDSTGPGEVRIDGVVAGPLVPPDLTGHHQLEVAARSDRNTSRARAVGSFRDR